MPKSIPCQFDSKGWAPCKKPSNNGWCTKHEGLQCSSCGIQATQSCDAGIGGLACGSPLCDTCRHLNDTHVTKEIADDDLRKRRAEREARIASRTSPKRRMNETLGVPLTLFELLKGDWRAEGYEIRKVYFLELEHGLMGFFPAILTSDAERIIFTIDILLLEKVWKILPPKKAKLQERLGYVNEQLGVVYLDAPTPEREDREPSRLLTDKEFSALLDSAEKPFKWASGLLGADHLKEDTFLQYLSSQASQLDPTFVSARA
jgi:hypothetical protein